MYKVLFVVVACIVMEHQDWTPVVLRKKETDTGGGARHPGLAGRRHGRGERAAGHVRRGSRRRRGARVGG